LKTKRERATQRANQLKKRYHSDPEYRKKQIEYAIAWRKRNLERINEEQRKRYANLSITEKKARLDKIKRMRKLGLWK